MTDLSLTVERTIQAAPKDVFEAWLNPEMLRRFMIPSPGMPAPTVSCDPQVGGRFEIVMKAESGEIPHSGIYREIVPHDRIVFTWESPFSVDGSVVTLEFSPVEQGTHVTLTQVRFADEAARKSHEAGWGRVLAILETTAIKQEA